MGWVPRVQKQPPTAFISYRRDDTAEFAQRLARGLKQDLDRAQVFLDVLDIPATAHDWWAVTEARLRRSDAAVILIGPGFFTPDTVSDDQPRGGAGGWAVHEARTARDAGIPLIRVLVDREVPPVESWPADLQPLFGPRAQYLTADDSDAGISSAHQQVLAGVWVALVSRVIGEDGAVYVVSDGTPEAGQALDLLLNQLPHAAHVTSQADLPEAAGFRAIARSDVEREFSKTLPDVIIVTRGEPTDTLRDRLRGMAACEAFGATTATVISASTVTGAAAPTVDVAGLQALVGDELGNVTTRLATAVGNLAPTTASGVTGWWAGLATASKAAIVGAVTVLVGVVAAGAISLGIDDDAGSGPDALGPTATPPPTPGPTATPDGPSPPPPAVASPVAACPLLVAAAEGIGVEEVGVAQDGGQPLEFWPDTWDEAQQRGVDSRCTAEFLPQFNAYAETARADQYNPLGTEAPLEYEAILDDRIESGEVGKLVGGTGTGFVLVLQTGQHSVYIEGSSIEQIDLQALAERVIAALPED